MSALAQVSESKPKRRLRRSPPPESTVHTQPTVPAEDINFVVTLGDEGRGIKRAISSEDSPATKKLRRDIPVSPTSASLVSSGKLADDLLASMTMDLSTNLEPEFGITSSLLDEIATPVVQPTNAGKESLNPTNTGKESQVKPKTRCVFFPYCTNQACQYFHPTEPCRNIATCQMGPQKCNFIHPPCKFKSRCTRRGCAYSHPRESTIDCKNGFNCTNRATTCVFRHPLEACKFQSQCRNQSTCMFSHAQLCNFGPRCRVGSCSFAHPTVEPNPKLRIDNDTTLFVDSNQTVQNSQTDSPGLQIPIGSS